MKKGKKEGRKEDRKELVSDRKIVSELIYETDLGALCTVFKD